MSEPKQRQPAPEKPKAQILPKRYDDILDERLKEAREVLQQAQAARPPVRWKRLLTVLGLLCLLVVVAILRNPAEPGKASVPFDRAAVVSADTLGVGVHALEFLRATPRPSPPPTPSPSPTPGPSPSPKQRAAMTRPRTVAPAPPRERVSVAMEEELLIEGPAVYVAALEETGPASLPPGTRVAVMLTSVVATGAMSVPVSATVVDDIRQGERVVVPAGSSLIGEAFATRSDDRVQVVFQALVRDGTSVPLRAIALGGDGQVGLQGTVVRKASKAKKGLGTVLGAIGSTLTLGAVGRSGPAEAVAEGLLASSASGLTDLERAWAAERSDKVVRVAPGTRLVAWIQAEARLP